ncbi:MAG: hypothetical protein WCF23_13625 [Candidatus Nitrosopolaris sp.]
MKYETETKSAAKISGVTEKQQEADAYVMSMLAKIRKRRKEIQKEIIELDSKLGLDSSFFFRNRRRGASASIK